MPRERHLDAAVVDWELYTRLKAKEERLSWAPFHGVCTAFTVIRHLEKVYLRKAENEVEGVSVRWKGQARKTTRMLIITCTGGGVTFLKLCGAHERK